jgi:hypothetical protein
MRPLLLRKTYFIALLTLLSGCITLGPKMVVRDRFDYTESISDSWKTQMLINLVKMRYGDAPVFLDVTSVITSYEMLASASLGGSFTSNPNIAGANLGITGAVANRPTVTYAPLSGEKFARSLMSPIPPSSVLNMIQSGYPVDLVLRLCVQSINGIENRFGGGMMVHKADPRFYSLIEKWKKIQDAGAMGIRLQPLDKKNESTLLVFRGKVDPSIQTEVAEARRILGVNPNSKEFKVSYGRVAEGDQEIAILTRSMLQVIIDLSSYMDVPAKDIQEGKVNASFHEELGGVNVEPLIQVKTSSEKPVEAFVAVPYHNYWFYIDDRDLRSKRMFSFLMFIMTLVETADKAPPAVVTIPSR